MEQRLPWTERIGMGSYCLTSMEFLFSRMKVLEMGGGNGCTTPRRYLTPLNCTPKTGQMATFIACIFYHNNRKKKKILPVAQNLMYTLKESFEAQTNR